MGSHQAEFTVRTGGRVDVTEITSQVRKALNGSLLRDGFLNVSVPHTTCAVVLNENETGLRRDIQRMAETLLDPLRRDGGFRHDRVDNNAQAHLTSILLGSSLTLPLASGAPVLGTWQKIMLVELDGPRSRTVRVAVVG